MAPNYSCRLDTTARSFSLMAEASIRISLRRAASGPAVVLAPEAGQCVLPLEDVADLAEVEAEQSLQLADLHDAGEIVLAVPAGPTRGMGGRDQQSDLLVPAKGARGHAGPLRRLADPVAR